MSTILSVLWGSIKTDVPKGPLCSVPFFFYVFLSSSFFCHRLSAFTDESDTLPIFLTSQVLPGRKPQPYDVDLNHPEVFPSSFTFPVESQWFPPNRGQL